MVGKQMIECIHFRAAGANEQQMVQDYLIQMAEKDGGAGSFELRLFRDIKVEGDLWIQIYSQGPGRSFAPSPIAVTLVHELKRHGQTHYTQWVEMARPESLERVQRTWV